MTTDEIELCDTSTAATPVTHILPPQHSVAARAVDVCHCVQPCDENTLLFGSKAHVHSACNHNVKFNLGNFRCHTPNTPQKFESGKDMMCSIPSGINRLVLSTQLLTRCGTDRLSRGDLRNCRHSLGHSEYTRQHPVQCRVTSRVLGTHSVVFQLTKCTALSVLHANLGWRS